MPGLARVPEDCSPAQRQRTCRQFAIAGVRFSPFAASCLLCPPTPIMAMLVVVLPGSLSPRLDTICPASFYDLQLSSDAPFHLLAGAEADKSQRRWESAIVLERKHVA